jgi:hypothetical protein
MRYSVRALLILTTIVALAAVALANAPFVVAGLVSLLLVSLPICFITAAIYARGYIQTFFVGAACAATMGVFSARGRTGDAVFLVLWAVIMCAVAGGLAIGTRRLIERQGWHLKPEDRDRWIDE